MLDATQKAIKEKKMKETPKDGSKSSTAATPKDGSKSSTAAIADGADAAPQAEAAHGEEGEEEPLEDDELDVTWAEAFRSGNHRF